MKQGDFTQLASSYHNRPGYSHSVLRLLGKYVGAEADGDFLIADVGAGTGKLTENLCECGWRCVAVEPNDAMRAEGEKATHRLGVEWKRGSGESTGLNSGSVNWVLMGSSFHWVKTSDGLREFRRILKPGGYFTALWNPRDIQSSELHKRIESRVIEIVPELNRVSSGSSEYTANMFERLVSTGDFREPIFVEAKHEVVMTKERYLGAWYSVNDIQAQAGPERFERIITAIKTEIEPLSEVIVPYRTRAWTAQRVD